METEFPRPSPFGPDKYEIVLPKYKIAGEPERYRLSAARLALVPEPRPTSLVHFWGRTRYISALASPLSRDHPHLLKLHLRPSLVARFIGGCLSFLPGFARAWAQRAFPEWFLPSNLVLKSQKQPQEQDQGEIVAELFDAEVKAYQRLRPLQGEVVPRCYGLCRYNRTRALILDHLPGVSLASPEGATLSLEELSALLQPCYRAMHAFGLVDGRIMALDLERVTFDQSEDDKAFFLKTNVEDMAIRYRGLQQHFRREGSLEAA